MAVLKKYPQPNFLSLECLEVTREANGAIGAVAEDRMARKALQRRSAFVAERDLHSARAGGCEVHTKAFSRHGDFPG